MSQATLPGLRLAEEVGSFKPFAYDMRPGEALVEARVWLLLPDFNPGNVIRQLGSGAKLATIFR